MRSWILALALSLGGTAAYACDCQKKQAEKQAQCDCPTQSCPGQCPGMDKQKSDKPKPEKKRS
jgi:hypothetical protein